jgi:hypothetical protein
MVTSPGSPDVVLIAQNNFSLNTDRRLGGGVGTGGIDSAIISLFHQAGADVMSQELIYQ